MITIYDPNVPLRLKDVEVWFASIIVRPIDYDNVMNPISPSGQAMEEEAFDYIRPSPTLKPAARIQIYNQQYWWRLYTVLQDCLPFVTRLFGYKDFNELIAKPYLNKYPPTSWSLNVLADLAPRWVEEDYEAVDKPLVYDAANLDVILNASFFAKRHEIENQNFTEGVIFLQPHVFLMDFRYNLVEFRKKMMEQEVEYWEENDFPKLVQDKRYYFVFYRNALNTVVYEEVSEAEYLLLQQFKVGHTLESACEWLENQEDSIKEEAAKNLHLYFQKWIFNRWLYLK